MRNLRVVRAIYNNVVKMMHDAETNKEHEQGCSEMHKQKVERIEVGAEAAEESQRTSRWIVLL